MPNEPITFNLDVQGLAKICELAIQVMNGPERLIREIYCEDRKVISLERQGRNLRVGARRYDPVNEAFAELPKN